MKRSPSEKAFQVFDCVLLVLIAALVILPLMNILSISVSGKEAVVGGTVGLLPKGINFEAYGSIIRRPVFLRSMANTIGIAVAATALSLIVNTAAAYGFSKKFYGRKVLTYFFVLTMYFSGGLIPTYLVIAKWLHLYNSYMAFLLPGAVNVFYMIVIRSQIEALPESLLEAAMIDGAKERQVLFRIVIPTILPTIAAVGMFVALANWNMWYPVLLYANKESLWSLQYFLRAMVFDKLLDLFRGQADMASDVDKISPVNYQMAAIILVALPIVAIYPFVQRYFVKGILVGSVKG